MIRQLYLKRVIFTIIPLAAVLLACTFVFKTAHAAPIQSSIIFSDTFDNHLLHGWTKYDDGATIGPSGWSTMQGFSSGVVINSGNAFGGATTQQAIEKPGTYLYGGNLGWADYTFSSRMKTDDDDAFGVMFRYTNNDNYYRFSMDRERGYRRLVKKVAGHYTTIWQDNTIIGNTSNTNLQTDAYKSNTWYKITISATGTTIHLTVTDESTSQPIVETTLIDNSLSSGLVALYSWGMNNAFFDDVHVEAKALHGFTIAVLPDTQNYVTTDTAANPRKTLFDEQTEWIAQNRGPKKIVFTLHEGDLVNKICSNEQWQSASDSMKILDGKVPYSFTPGNHDIIAYSGTDGCAGTHDTALQGTYATKTLYDQKINQYFGPSRYPELNGALGGKMNLQSTANTYRLFSAGGIDFLVLNLQFGPNDAILAWAGGIVDQYPSRTVILLTHDYLSQSNALRGTTGTCTYPSENEIKFCTVNNSANGTQDDWALPSITGQRNGKQIWESLVKSRSSIRFVLNGHVGASGGTNPNFTTEGAIGKLVTPYVNSTKKSYQMLANYQAFMPSGGKGYMRLLKFIPQANSKWSVEVSTYSPSSNTYLVNGQDNPLRIEDQKNQFTLYDVEL